MLQQRNHRKHWPKIKEIFIFSINSNPKVGRDSKASSITLPFSTCASIPASKTLFLLLQCSVKWRKKREKCRGRREIRFQVMFKATYTKIMCIVQHNFKINLFSFFLSKNYDPFLREAAVFKLKLEEKRGKYFSAC